MIRLLCFFSLATAIAVCTSSTNAAHILKVDFNSSQDNGGTPGATPDAAGTANHNQTGWSSYHAAHEVAAGFTAGTYGGITVTPAWPNTTDNRVQQSIDRTDQDAAGAVLGAWDAGWDNTNGDINLVTDFIGTDTRTQNGGNGDWDGATGTPTYMTVSLGGLSAGPYNWTSLHHDTEKVWASFAAWVSTDGGASYTPLADGQMTNTGTGSVPVPPVLYAGPDAFSLPSVYSASFTANGTDDVVMRFAPYSGEGVHKQIWGMNGFQIEAVPEPSTVAIAALGLVGLGLFSGRRRQS